MTKMGLALASLRHRLLRTMLTVMSIAVAIAIFTATASIAYRVKAVHKAAQAYPRLVTFASVWGEDQPLSHYREIQNAKLFDTIDYLRFFRGVDDKFRYSLRAVSDNMPNVIPPDYWRVAPDVFDRWLKDKQGFVASPEMMKHFGWQVGQLATLPTNIGPLSIRISGVSEGYYTFGVGHYDLFDQALPLAQRGKVRNIVSIATPEQMDQMAAKIDALFEKTSDPTLTMPLDMYHAANMDQATMIPDLLNNVSVLILLVTMLVSGSSLSLSLRERQSEFGSLQAMGFTRGQVLIQIFTESIATNFLGGLVGAGIPFLLWHTKGFSIASVEARGLEFIVVPPQACLMGIGISIALGFLVAILPAARIVRQDPLTNLAGR